MKPRQRIRGFSHERDLVKKLWDKGFAAMRSPASGSKTKRVKYPDIVALKNGKIIVLEVKTISKERTVYIDSYQVEKLKIFSERSGGEPYIAVKIIGSGEWRFIPLEHLERTDSGRYKLTIDMIRNGLLLKDLISRLFDTRRIDEFM